MPRLHVDRDRYTPRVRFLYGKKNVPETYHVKWHSNIKQVLPDVPVGRLVVLLVLLLMVSWWTRVQRLQ